MDANSQSCFDIRQLWSYNLKRNLLILNKKLRKLVKYFTELHLDIYRHSELYLGEIIHAISIARFSFKRFSTIFYHDIIESK